jgi:GcrA cell cycle regulator
MKWTPEQDNRIAELLRAKKTASEIGAEMGVTRNSIIGRVARCKMLKAIGFERAPSEKTTDGPRRSRRRLASVKPIVILPAAKKPEPVRPLAEPHHVGRPLDVLPACRCKFALTPHDTPKDAHLFCGEVTKPGKSWCAWHEQIVWGRGTASETATVKSAERIAA